MKKLSVIVSIVMMMAFAVPASAYITNFNNVLGNGGFTSPYSNVVETFDGTGGVFAMQQGWSWVGNRAFVQGTSGDAAAPWWYPTGARDLTYYVTVPDVLSAGAANSVTVEFGGATYNYFGLWWGSMDNYNTLTFLLAGGGELSVTGSSFSSGSGAQEIQDTNKYVNFLGLPEFYGFRMTSTQYAFEADNIAVGRVNVPEPLSLILFGSGLLGLLGLRRKLD